MISYLAGIAGYWIGVYLNHTRFYRILKRRVFGKYQVYLNKFGTFLIIVAALTPLPFSGIAMLVGSSRYPFKKYIVYSSFRFLRFVIYSYIIWEASIF
jgi:membrane protein YqaA with SNARE-associated domain